MEMRLLAVGDIVAESGLRYLKQRLRTLKREKRIDFCIVNGENTAILGMTPQQAEDIFSAGADVITMGNHTWGRRELITYLEDSPYVLRPANLPPQQPGRGWGIYDSPFGDIAVIDLIGRCGMDYTPDNPFLLVDKLLKKLETKLIFVELHAEATSEKLAMGWMLDGRVSALWGTHTHVQTADDRLLPLGTGYLTDLGMTGPMDSVLGIRPELSIQRFRGDLTGRYEPASGRMKLEGCIFTIDAITGRCTGTERVMLHD